MLVHFGDFVGGSEANVADPYIQLLSTVNKMAAHRDFVNARLGGVDTTGSQAPLAPASTVGDGSGQGGASPTGKVNNSSAGKPGGFRISWVFLVSLVLVAVARGM